MWWPLIELGGRPPRIDTGRFRFQTVAEDIETLNRFSEQARYDITAMSCAQYARVADRYALTACGASIGEGYGPKVVAARPMSVDELRDGSLAVAIPGRRTTAFAALQILLGGRPFRLVEMEFSAIMDAVVQGQVDVGLVIHEGQLTFADSKLHEVADLGRWWREVYGLPLPLGVNAIRRDLDRRLGDGAAAAVTDLLRCSVEYALAHREQSLAYALQFGRGVSLEQADAFCSMYVNRWTLDFGPVGRQAVHTLLAAGAGLGVLPEAPEIQVYAGSGASDGRTRPKRRD